MGSALEADAAPPAAAYAAWPFLDARAIVTLPQPPAPSEVLALTCVARPVPLTVTLAPGGAIMLPCDAGAAPRYSLCAVFPSQSFGLEVEVAVAVSLPSGGALPPADAAKATLSCELTSTLNGDRPSDPRLLPRFPLRWALSLPLVAFPARQPMLRSMAVESRTAAGSFRVAAGLGAGTVLPQVPLPSSIAAWNSPLFASDVAEAGLAPLLSALSQVVGDGGIPAPLALTLSASAHVLLLFSPAAPVLASLNVSLNSFPCAVNWVAGNGTVVSVTTPPLAAICGSAGCKSLSLVLRQGRGDPRADLLAALRGAGGPGPAAGDGGADGPGGGGNALAARRLGALGGGDFMMPAAYPPMQVPALAPSPAITGLSFADVVTYTSAMAPPGSGVVPVDACADPTYAPAEDCALVGGRLPPAPAAGVCAYGSASTCAPCPSFAYCPGGNVLLLRPGYWAPLPTSPPRDVVPCQPPAEARCSGWEAALTSPLGSLCGPGYTGAACAACSRGFFSSQSECKLCPSLEALAEESARVPLLFATGLFALGAVLNLVARRALAKASGRAAPCCFRGGSLTIVGSLLVWAWGAAQTLSAIFSQAVDDGTLPRALVPVFSAFSALQFKGVSVAPACSQRPPFETLSLATGLSFLLFALGSLCVAVLAVGWGGATTAPPRLLAFSLSACVIFFSVGYGALVSTAVAALACGAPKAMTVRAYVETSGDGAAVAAALGRAYTNMTVLRRAAVDPLFSQRAGLSEMLASSVTVALLASDPNVVCGEGAHVVARRPALALLALLAGMLPALAIGALLSAGRLKGLQRLLLLGACPCEARTGKGGAKAPPTPKLVVRVLDAPPFSTTRVASPLRGAPGPRFAPFSPRLFGEGGVAAGGSPPGADVRALNPLVARGRGPPASPRRTAWGSDQPPAEPSVPPQSRSGLVSCPRAAALIIVSAFENEDLQSRAQWLVAHNWALTALCTGATAFAATATTLQEYLVYQVAMAFSLLASALLLRLYRPSVERSRWRDHVQALLYLLAGAAAISNVVLRYVLPAASDGAFALGTFLLLCAVCIFAWVFVSWYRGLVPQGAQLGIAARGASSAVVGRGGGFVARDPTPSHAHTTRPPPSLPIAASVSTVNPLAGSRREARTAAEMSPARRQQALLEAYKSGAVQRITAHRGLNMRREAEPLSDRHTLAGEALAEEDDISPSWASPT